MSIPELNPAEQVELQKLLQYKEMQGMMKSYITLVDDCFKACCNDFTSRALSTKEATCVDNCTEKFRNYTQRAAQLYKEQETDLMQTLQAKSA